MVQRGKQGNNKRNRGAREKNRRIGCRNVLSRVTVGVDAVSGVSQSHIHITITRHARRTVESEKLPRVALNFVLWSMHEIENCGRAVHTSIVHSDEGVVICDAARGGLATRNRLESSLLLE